MKKIVSEFFLKGLIAGGFGPVVLAIIYFILKQCGVIDTLTAEEVAVGILSLYSLAFISGGIGVIHQIERLPLMLTIFIHGSVLYISYLVTYLVNDWIVIGTMPIVIFTVFFVVGYLAIWVVIYLVHRKSTDKINRMLQEKQQEI